MNAPPTAQPARGKNLRPCPAVNGFISPADCGAQRGSRLACPADCVFFPFGHAAPAAWANVEGSWTKKAVEYAIAQRGQVAFAHLMKRMTLRMEDPTRAEHTALLLALHYSLFEERDADRRTLAERWEAEQWRGLNNDERLMMRCRWDALPTVIEVLRQVDNRQVRCTDLYEPGRGEFTVHDRNVAAVVPRFGRIFTWVVHYPHVSRVGPAAREIPHEIWPEWQAEVQRRFHEAASSEPGLTLKRYLAREQLPLTDLLGQLARQYRDRAFQSLDFHRCTTRYALVASAEAVEAALRARPDFQANEAPAHSAFEKPTLYFDWLRLGESAALESELEGALLVDGTVNGVGTVGGVWLYPDRLMVEVLSKKKHEFARRMLERHLGELVKFDHEDIVDLAQVLEHGSQRDAIFAQAEAGLYGGAQAAEAQPAEPQPAPLIDPPNPTLQPEELAAAEAAHRTRFTRLLDLGTGTLGGQSPRAAAQDAALRPQLVEWTKTQINLLERENRQRGTRLNLDWALDELGLAELK
ncbi:MAG: hypothetical protein FJ387_06580 [Verrucomicrobia bacterium]|nr:hypothetical protein [Verrucomicrobiota bacterium]